MRQLGPDRLAIVPIRNPDLGKRSMQIQSMAQRALPAAVRAFLDHMCGQADESAVGSPASRVRR
jgi:hypothetical protein